MLKHTTTRHIACLLLFCTYPFLMCIAIGIGDQEDDYTKPCETTRVRNITDCHNLEIVHKAGIDYYSFDFVYSYKYKYQPQDAPFLDPMYMQFTIKTCAGSGNGMDVPVDLYTDPSLPSPPTSIGQHLIVSAPLTDPGTGKERHDFLIEAHIKVSDVNFACGFQLLFNFWDMYEPSTIIDLHGVPYDPSVTYETGDIAVFSDGSYFHYEEHVETILSYQYMLCLDPNPPVADRQALPISANESPFIAAQIAPNPSSHACLLTLQTFSSGPITIAMFDANGRLIKTYLWREEKEAGLHREKIHLAEVPAGIYYLHISLNEKVEIIKLLKM